MLRNFLINNRPISPHLSVYNPQLSSLFSIWHRITGVLLSSIISLYLLFLKVFTMMSYNYLEVFQSFIFKFYSIDSLVDYLYLIILILFFYHVFNGTRHITWDMGFLIDTRSLFFSSSIFVVILVMFILRVLV